MIGIKHWAGALALAAGLLIGLTNAQYATAAAQAAQKPAQQQAASEAKLARDCSASVNGIPFCGAKFLSVERPAENRQEVALFDMGYVIIYGTHADVAAARQFFEPNTNLLWFRRNGKTYVSRDSAIIRQASVLIVPAFKEQRMLLHQHTELRAQWIALIDQQQKLIALKADMVQEDGSGSERNQMVAVKVRAQRAKIDALQHALETRRVELQTRQRVLSDRLKIVPSALTKLVDAAFANGSARRVDE